MGMFDSVIVKCEDCGGEVEFQSKAGSCLLRTYSLNDTPPEIAADLDGETQRCYHCGNLVTLHYKFTVVGFST